jgi:hypothetical protein
LEVEAKMKKKIVGIFVCMLLIGATGIAVADWSVGDGHKMHFPQLPDPNGWDIDFGYWYLADDWRCSETGPVGDIHFWISWWEDNVQDISWIQVEIWSNNPQGPGGYSQPLDKKWEHKFYPAEFIIAGPWDGVQGWMLPWYEAWPDNHFTYYQINIPDIDEPFDQNEGEIYWLVIQMSFAEELVVGWKNTNDYFMDHAVWSEDPDIGWYIIDGIDFAFVITGEDSVPDLDCDGDISWSDVPVGSTVSGNFVVMNIGDPGSLLNWEITEWPIWGNWTFTPISGTGLKPADGAFTVQVDVVAPEEKNKDFSGTIKIVNLDDTTDTCRISVSLATPRNKPFNMINFLFLRFLESHPYLFPILRQALGL